MSDTDAFTLAEAILDAARGKGVMIATAESCTGGMVAAALTEIAGSSDVFERGFVTYSNAAKVSMLGVRQETLDAHGAVSEETARDMAEGALTHSKADLAVSITGIAGPGGGSQDKPIGLVCFGLAQKGKETISQPVRFADHGRAGIRDSARMHALQMLKTALD